MCRRTFFMGALSVVIRCCRATRSANEGVRVSAHGTAGALAHKRPPGAALLALKHATCQAEISLCAKIGWGRCHRGDTGCHASMTLVSPVRYRGGDGSGRGGPPVTMTFGSSLVTAPSAPMMNVGPEPLSNSWIMQTACAVGA